MSAANPVASGNVISAADLPSIEDTAMSEYLELVQAEYQIERGKKESFENRAGIVMALIGALLVFVMENIPFNTIINLSKTPLTFVVWIKILIGFVSYGSLIVALGFSFFYDFNSETRELSYLRNQFIFFGRRKKRCNCKNDITL